MSQKDALAFISKVGDDAELQKQVGTAKLSAWVEAGNKAGLSFTEDELKQASRGFYKELKKSSNLSDEQLSGVTGGAISMAESQFSYSGLRFNVLNLAKLDAFKLAAW